MKPKEGENEMSQLFSVIGKMSKNDKERLMQCLLCARDIDNCNIEDEDEQGFCNQYKKRDDIEFVRRSEK